MLYIEIEEIANSLKGVASILSTMSEATDGSIIWNEWAIYLLYKELNEDIKKLETIENCKDDEETEEEQ